MSYVHYLYSTKQVKYILRVKIIKIFCIVIIFNIKYATLPMEHISSSNREYKPYIYFKNNKVNSLVEWE